jgi:fluoride ion exporter CrcB/FEX
MSGLAMAFVLMVGNFGVMAGLVYILVQFVAGLFAYALGFKLGKGAWPSV